MYFTVAASITMGSGKEKRVGLSMTATVPITTSNGNAVCMCGLVSRVRCQILLVHCCKTMKNDPLHVIAYYLIIPCGSNRVVGMLM